MAENVIQRKIIKDLKLSGWKVIKIILCSESGTPDILAGKNGRAVWIEAKDKGKKAEPLQEHRKNEWIDFGFDVFVIDTWEQYLQIKYHNL